MASTSVVPAIPQTGSHPVENSYLIAGQSEIKRYREKHFESSVNITTANSNGALRIQLRCGVDAAFGEENPISSAAIAHKSLEAFDRGTNCRRSVIPELGERTYLPVLMNPPE